jgi:uncharacterized protein (DUF58 family)
MPRLDPDLLTLLHRCRIEVRTNREKAYAGLHRSHHPGDGLEFVEFREYHPGDPIRFLDWRVLARTDRPYVRRFGHETAVLANVYVDASASMGVAIGGPSKLSFASELAVYLAFVLAHQGDRVRVSTFREGRVAPLPFGGGSDAVPRLADALSAVVPRGDSDLAALLHDVEVERPQLVFLLSDLLVDADALDRVMRVSRMEGVDLRLLHLLDRRELTFDFEAYTRFEDPEERAFKLEVHPRSIRDRYLEALEGYLRRLEHAAADQAVAYARFATDQPVREAVLRYLEEGRGGT